MDWDKDKPVIPGLMAFGQLYRKAEQGSAIELEGEAILSTVVLN